MKAKLKYSSEELRKARANGFKRKRPKKPTKRLTVDKVESYIDKFNDWVKEIKKNAKDYESKKSKSKKYTADKLRQMMK